MKPKDWHYPEAQPIFAEPGEFDAWVSGSGGQERSAAVWLIRSKSAPSAEFEPVRKSEGKSSAQRATLGSLAGVLESVQPKSTINCYTNSTYAIGAGQNAEAQAARGWEGSKGPLANQDILKRIHHVLTSRQITLSMQLIGDGVEPHHSTIERLTRRARGAWR
ncbi:MAG: hypothetical protein EOS03_00505 [Mesorhizobium sp.]|uniref:RNase H family protein n=1 Tax=Mesorhizobium sp. TaxID=1871066 RepID=UPI000FE76A07|nr:MAG: hypothetical protein EOS03_00505 [Mesorhizobium sp.]